MRKSIFLAFLLINSFVSAKTYYVAINGNDLNSGSISQPWNSWGKAFQTAAAGDTVYFRGGIYYVTAVGQFGNIANSGNSSNPICFFNYPGEVPILDFGHFVAGPWTYAIRVNNDNYLIFKGLTIRNLVQFSSVYIQAMYIENSHDIIVENCSIYNIGGPAFGIYGCDAVYVKNCDAWNLCDSLATRPGQNGDGFQWASDPALFGEEMYNYRIYFEGCRAWNFGDNGFAGTGVSYVEMKNCWAFNGGILAGDGCGFKYSISTTNDINNPLSRKIINCIAANNGLVGFTPNNSGGNVFNGHYFNNFAYHNGYKHDLLGWDSSYGNGFWGFDYLGTSPAPNELFLNNIAYANEHENFWEIEEMIDEFNSWNSQTGVKVTDTDFISLDWTEMLRPRKADGSLPDIDFGKLASGSDLIDAGTTKSGLPYNGLAPDLGCFESSGSITPNPPASPVYVSSVIENTTPSRLDITYNLTLVNVVPAASAFTVKVNTVTRTISSVAISGSKVLLTLASPVVYGDAVTVAYTKPVSNPLQTAAGGQAASITAQNVANNVTAVNPAYVSSVIENGTPSRLEMAYNLTLANVVPAASAFEVKVNTVARTVSSVAISGTKVLLTLASPILNGDVVTVAYTKPASNPLQTAAGGQAASITAQNVTNNVAAVNPNYVSSVIENATPSRLEMTYNLTLANVVPAASAFEVKVNTVTRTVSSVAISGTKVLLTLASPVVYGDAVTVAYTKPASNPLQTAAGGQAASLTAQNVTNNVAALNPVYVSSVIENATPSRLEMTYNLTLANVVPAASAFTVKVNTVTRTVSSVAISGTKVLLTLASPVVYSDAVTVAYTKPASNPLQSAAGGQAVSISAQNVTNKVGAVNQPPVVNISSPTKSTSFISPATITIDAVASDPDGAITKVEFYSGTVKLGEITTSPYSYTWKEVSEGTYSITAAATDNQNMRTVSSAVAVVVEKSITVVNQLPVVRITLPNRKKPKKYDNVVIVAEASDPDGTINKVELKNGSITIAEFTTAPYTYILQNVDTGTYSFTAIATDNLGAVSTSSVIELRVEDFYDANSDMINLYPNPNDGNFTIDILSELPAQDRRLTVVNLSGKTVYNNIMTSEERSRQFGLTEIPAGTYVLMVTSGNSILTTKKFIIHQ